MGRSKLHYAWVIFACCCCFFAGGIALSDNIAGIYIPPVSEALGVGRGDFSFYLVIEGVTTALTAPIWARLMVSKNFNLVMGLGSLLFCGGLLGFGISSQLWHYYCFAVLVGAGIAVLYTLCDSVLISNWFSSERRGKVLGIAGAFSGFGTFVWAPLFTLLIQNYGVSTAYFINAGLAFLLTFPMAAFLVKRTPAERGLLPYGYEADTLEVRRAIESGATPKVALRTPAFWLIVAATVCMSMGAGYVSSLPGIALENASIGGGDPDRAAMVGAFAISAVSLGNVTGKIAFGLIRDKFGSGAAWLAFVLIVLVGLLGLAFSRAALAFVASGFLFGFHFALISVAPPLLARDLFGGKYYSQIWSYLCVPFSIWGCVSSSVVGKIFDATGSYSSAFVLGIVSVLAVCVCALFAHRQIGKIKFEWTDCGIAHSE